VFVVVVVVVVAAAVVSVFDAVVVVVVVVDAVLRKDVLGKAKLSFMKGCGRCVVQGKVRIIVLGSLLALDRTAKREKQGDKESLSIIVTL
jgi:hypothetical protein